MTDEKIAYRVSFVSMIVNMILSAGKLLAGIIGHSSAMVSDAIHSASDVISTIVVIIGIKVSNKDADDHHQYGHERLECVAAIVLAMMLAATGLGIGKEGLNVIFNGNPNTIAIPSLVTIIAAVVSIITKEGMFWYTRINAKKINSGALMADAYHHRSDALSSIGALVGIIGARHGYPILDPIASLVICICILKAAIDIFKDAIEKMIDQSCDEETVELMKKVIVKQEGVQRVDVLRTRLFGSKIFVDVEIAVDGNLSLNDAHKIAENVHDVIESTFSYVKHCMVHVNPY